MRRSWVAGAAGHLFDVHTLPYCSFTSGRGPRHVGVGIGDQVLDLTEAAPGRLGPDANLFDGGDLDALLAAGPATWRAVRAAVGRWLTDPAERPALETWLLAGADVDLHLPFTVADYVDFYASEDHATNVGRLFRPGGDPLPANWKHLPVGYHGRAGTVVVSGTDVIRPRGQHRGAGGEIAFGPTARLDLEAEVGFVVGAASPRGSVVALDDLPAHVFGVCLVNDWSARDIQARESAPLGPFLGKSFATSIGSWVVPLDALSAARVAPPPRRPRPLPYLDDEGHPPWGLDLDLEVRINDQVVSRPPFQSMYWTPAQMLAHLTVNGASLRPGDLFASGTVSGPSPDQMGCLLELTAGGSQPLTLADGTVRAFLEDGDEVVITATAPGPDGSRLGLGEVRGRIRP